MRPDDDAVGEHDEIPPQDAERRSEEPAAPGSMTAALAALGAADTSVRDEGARRLWERFAPRLCALARSRLNPRIRVREDENDVVQSLFRSFFDAQRGEASPLRSREDLWRLLVWMTLCKVANAANHHQRALRDVRRERPSSSRNAPSSDGADRIAEFEDLRGLSPEEEIISRVELGRMLDRLREDQRRIIAWKLEGYTNAEIGRKLERTERTVELKLRLIRGILERDPWVAQELAELPGRGGSRDP